MVTLSEREAVEWCLGHGLRLTECGVPDVPVAFEPFRIPQDAGRWVAMGAEHLRSCGDAPETLVWFTTECVWPSSERPRLHYFHEEVGWLRA
jgi:hypothetical protein